MVAERSADSHDENRFNSDTAQLSKEAQNE